MKSQVYYFKSQLAVQNFKTALKACSLLKDFLFDTHWEELSE